MPENKEILERLNQLEMNQAFHDDNIEALERTVAIQHQEIQLLEKKLMLLSDYIKTLKQDAIKDPKDEVPPPHY
ncbi:hypothetical protein THMIRHAM_11660 [Thiomicrorhabdus immobilis]|uniref:Protein SlyX homolog n=1 Tax=Thiomicrorhabdus immobilis TaxID=2791037 RepID=A0ABM7MDH2_9GAMM|nr:SlyX family protein [Thiomicrorhabdus immobilis]BCN93381.1 hypothetical protein THMIRHAM_11660 [Thiomicrorhabdus immobilis]